MTLDVILGSRSPRRLELLQRLGLDPQLVVAPIDETPAADERPAAYVKRMALEKWHAVATRAAGRRSGTLIVTADTAVVVDDELLGKPADRTSALAMLGRLSGRAHRVLTAVAVGADDAPELALSETEVFMRTIDEREASNYWASGEPRDKAGSYAIQGLGGIFVERIDGSFTGVMGLPVFETARLLRRAGIDLPRNDGD